MFNGPARKEWNTIQFGQLLLGSGADFTLAIGGGGRVGAGVAVGPLGVAVGGSGVAVGGWGVAVGPPGVAVGPPGVAVGSQRGSTSP